MANSVELQKRVACILLGSRLAGANFVKEHLLPLAHGRRNSTSTALAVPAVMRVGVLARASRRWAVARKAVTRRLSGGRDGGILIASNEEGAEAVSRTTNAPFDLRESSRSLIDVTQKTTGCKDLALLLRSTEEGVFCFEAGSGYPGKGLSRVRFGQDSALITHFAAHPVPTPYRDLEKIPWFKTLPSQEREAAEGLRGGLFIPICTKTGLEGLLVLGKEIARHKGYDGAGLPLSRFRQLAAAIEEARDHYQLKDAPKETAPGVQEPSPLEGAGRLEDKARSVAHDINNVLSSILFHVRLIELKDEDSSEDVKQHALSISQAVLDVADSVRRMSSCTEQLEEPQFRTLDLNALVSDTLQMLYPHWRDGLISASTIRGPGSRDESREAMVSGWGLAASVRELAINFGPTSWVSGCAAELRRVLTNILANALDVLPSSRGRIEITSGQVGNFATVSIKDNGSGIPLELRSRIFQPNSPPRASGAVA